MNQKLNNATQIAPAWRFYIVMSLLAILASLLVWRILELQVLDSDRGYEFLQGQGNARTLRAETIPAYRGVISDRNGEPLAVSTPVSSIWINPQELKNERHRWGELAVSLDIPRSQIEKKIENNARRSFAYLLRHLSPKSAAKVMALRIKGVNVKQEYKRYYPAGEVAAHVVGFSDIDDRGQEGMELAYDSWLKGDPGKRHVLKDLRGNIFRDVDKGFEAKPGKSLSLSLDMRLQHLAHRELKSALKRIDAKSGSVVVLDSESGEVLAMVNQPAFNPNNRRRLKSANLRNRAMTDMFEPGSTVKPLTVVAALESGKYRPDSLIDTNPGHIRIGKKTILDPVNYGVIDVTKLLTKSSQVGTSKLALDLDEQLIWNVFNRFGLGVSTSSGFPGESAGLLPNKSKWLPIERANFAFGYGLTVTPLQLAQAYSVFASGGLFRPVTLLRNEESTGEESSIERIIDEKISRQIVEMLKTVTLKGGTATSAQIAAYSVAGKTGTTHKVGKTGYESNRYTAVFAGLAPASNPRLVAVVMIDEPNLKNYHGGEAAAPVFSKIVGEALRLMDVVPDTQPPSSIAGAKKLFDGGPKSLLAGGTSA